MKIQLDLTEKTITIEEDVNLNELYDVINGLLPGGKWREFTLKQKVIIDWGNPITLPNNPWTTPTIEPYWYQNPIITCDNNNTKINFEIK
jgi:hypothetical protein